MFVGSWIQDSRSGMDKIRIRNAGSRIRQAGTIFIQKNTQISASIYVTTLQFVIKYSAPVNEH
jgi:hypothetical protein